MTKKQLRQQLVKMHPTPADLEMMVQDVFDVNIHTIVNMNSNTETIAFNLIRWAESHGYDWKLRRHINEREAEDQGKPQAQAATAGLGEVIVSVGDTDLPSNTTMTQRLLLALLLAVPSIVGLVKACL